MTDIHNIVPFPPVSGPDAEAAGYAQFNNQPTLCVDIPDGGFTISACTSEGKRITFAFMPYKTGGAPQCVDVAYHDNGTIRVDRPKDKIPTFDVVMFGQTERKHDAIQIDTRKQPFKPGIVCVLMDDRNKGEAA